MSKHYILIDSDVWFRDLQIVSKQQMLKKTRINLNTHAIGIARKLKNRRQYLLSHRIYFEPEKSCLLHSN